MDGRRGLFPISYVDVIVDCVDKQLVQQLPIKPQEDQDKKETQNEAAAAPPPPPEPLVKSTAVTVHDNLLTNTYHKVK